MSLEPLILIPRMVQLATFGRYNFRKTTQNAVKTARDTLFYSNQQYGCIQGWKILVLTSKFERTIMRVRRGEEFKEEREVRPAARKTDS